MAEGASVVDGHIERGNAAFKAGDFAAALAAYDAALALAPNSARALGNRAAALAKAERFEDATKDAQRCTELEPATAKHWWRLGTALRARNRFEESAHALRSAVALASASGSASDAEAYRAELREVEAALVAGRGVASDTTRTEFYFKRSLEQGKKSMEQGVFVEAVRHFTKALECCPTAADRPVLLCNRAAAHFRDGQFAESAEDARAAVACAVPPGGYARAHLRLGLALEAMADAKAALAGPAAGTPLRTEAAAAFAAALRIDPDNAQAAEAHAAATKRLAASPAAAKAANEAADRELAAQSGKVLAARREAIKASREGVAVEASASASGGNDPDAVRVTSGGGVSAADQALLASLSRGGARVGYAHCKFCNQYGHREDKCPQREFNAGKKRPR